jgi:hypothetical protein
MRTTIAIDDDILRSVKSYAEGRSISLGKAVTELVRRGLEAPLRTRRVNGFLVVDLPPDSPVVGTADVRRLEEELP